MKETAKIGKRGVVVIPAKLRKRLGLEEGSLVIIEQKGERLSLRPAVALPLEMYSPERKAEFLLQNAVDKADYLKALREVKKLGIDPQRIPHARP